MISYQVPILFAILFACLCGCSPYNPALFGDSEHGEGGGAVPTVSYPSNQGGEDGAASTITEENGLSVELSLDDESSEDGSSEEGGSIDEEPNNGSGQEGGSADDDSSEGGFTSGDATSGGSTDEESDEGSDQDGGTTDDNSSEGGNSNGGSANGGSSNGGSSNGGSSNGGSSNGGSRNGTPSDNKYMDAGRGNGDDGGDPGNSDEHNQGGDELS